MTPVPACHAPGPARCCDDPMCLQVPWECTRRPVPAPCVSFCSSQLQCFANNSGPHTETTLVAPSNAAGLLFIDGRDAKGRPVIILNSGALPDAGRRDEALTMAIQVLEPVVAQVR